MLSHPTDPSPRTHSPGHIPSPSDYGLGPEYHLAPPRQILPVEEMTHRRKDGSLISTSNPDIYAEETDKMRRSGNPHNYPQPKLVPRTVPRPSNEPDVDPDANLQDVYIPQEHPSLQHRPHEMHRGNPTHQVTSSSAQHSLRRMSEEEYMMTHKDTPQGREPQYFKSAPTMVRRVVHNEEAVAPSQNVPHGEEYRRVPVIRESDAGRHDTPYSPSRTATAAPAGTLGSSVGFEQRQRAEMTPTQMSHTPSSTAGLSGTSIHSTSPRRTRPLAALGAQSTGVPSSHTAPTATAHLPRTPSAPQPSKGGAVQPSSTRSVLPPEHERNRILPPTFKELSLLIESLGVVRTLEGPITRDDLLVHREVLYLRESNMTPLSPQNHIHLLLNPAHHDELMHLLAGQRGSGQAPDLAMIDLRAHLRGLFGVHRVHCWKVENFRYMMIIGETLSIYELVFHQTHPHHWGSRLKLPAVQHDVSQLVRGEIRLGIIPASRPGFDVATVNALHRFLEGEAVGVYPFQGPEFVNNNALNRALSQNTNSLYFTFGKPRRIMHRENVEGYYIILYYSHNTSGGLELVQCTQPYRYNQHNAGYATRIVLPKIEGRNYWSMRVVFIQDSGIIRLSMLFPVYNAEQFVQMALAYER